MMLLKLEYVFASLSPFFFKRGRVRNLQKMNRHLLGKTSDVFPQNSTFSIQIVIIILKIDVTLKSFLAVQFFNYCLNQLFP